MIFSNPLRSLPGNDKKTSKPTMMLGAWLNSVNVLWLELTCSEQPNFGVYSSKKILIKSVSYSRTVTECWSSYQGDINVQDNNWLKYSPHNYAAGVDGEAFAIMHALTISSRSHPYSRQNILDLFINSGPFPKNIHCLLVTMSYFVSKSTWGS